MRAFIARTYQSMTFQCLGGRSVKIEVEWQHFPSLVHRHTPHENYMFCLLELDHCIGNGYVCIDASIHKAHTNASHPIPRVYYVCMFISVIQVHLRTHTCTLIMHTSHFILTIHTRRCTSSSFYTFTHSSFFFFA